MGGGSWMNVIGVAGVTSVVVCQETFVIPDRFGNLLEGSVLPQFSKRTVSF